MLNIVNVLGVGLRERLPIVGADPKVAVPGSWPRFQVGAKLLSGNQPVLVKKKWRETYLPNRQSDDRVRNSNVDCSNCVDAIEYTVLDRAVVQDDVRRGTHVESTLPSVGIHVALTHAEVADDDIGLSARRDLPGHDTDPWGRCSLAIDRCAAR
jgi:hypothetical protein